MAPMAPLVRYWLKSAREDLRATGTLLRAGHYRLAMFCCHLAMEKALKAVLQHQTGRLPPRLHDLRVLLTRAGLVPPLQLRQAIDRVADLSVPARYPGRLSTARLGWRRDMVERRIRQAGKVLQWCREQCR